MKRRNLSWVVTCGFRFLSACVLSLVFATGCPGGDGDGGVAGFTEVTPADLAQKSFRFAPEAGLFDEGDSRFGQSATLTVGEFYTNGRSAGFSLTTDDGSLQGGVLSLGSCSVQTTYLQLAGQAAQVGDIQHDYFVGCGVDAEGRLGLFEDEEEVLIVSEPPSVPGADLDERISMSRYFVVEPRFDPDALDESGLVELRLHGNVLSFWVDIYDLSPTDEVRDAHFYRGGAPENGDMLFTLFGSPVQPVRMFGPPFLEGSDLKASVFVTPEEVATLTDATSPLYVGFPSIRFPAGLLRGQLFNAPVGAEGGVLAYPNGVRLEVPAGALSESTAIEVTELPMAEVNAILTEREYAFLEKRLLGGFFIEPDMTFNVPIKGIVPVLQPESYELMWRMEVDFEGGKWWPVETELNYLARRGVAEIEIPHTSNGAILGGSGLSTEPDALRQQYIDTLCKAGLGGQICEDLDPLQDACCQLYDYLRPKDCICCRRLDQRQQSNASDFAQNRASGVCEFLSDRVISQYFECFDINGDTVPPQSHIASEVSPHCPSDMAIEIDIAPRSPRLRVCQTQQFTATMRGVDADGNEIMPPQSFDPVWRAGDPSKAVFITNAQGNFDGTLLAKGVGTVLVDANPGLPQYPLGIATWVTIESNIRSFTASPPALEIAAEQERIVSATVVLADGGAVDESKIRWTPAAPHIASVILDSGALTSIVAGERGCTEIAVSYQYDCETAQIAVPVCVECSPLEMTVRPGSVELLRQGSAVLEVEILDKDGSLVDASSVKWVSGDSAVADVLIDTGPATSVFAIDYGMTEVTALYEDDCQIKRATATVNVGCVDLELTPNFSIIEVDDSVSIAVIARDSNREQVEIRESDLTWDSEDWGTAAPSPASGRSTVAVEGIEAGSTLIAASYDDGSCPRRTGFARVVVTEETGIAGLWRLSPTSQTERCRYLDSGWLPQDDATPFTVKVSQSPQGDGIAATYVPNVGPVLSGSWDQGTGEFDLSVSTTSPDQCRYLFEYGDICGEATDCMMESCQNSTEVTGTTDEDVETLEAESAWNYQVTFSFSTPAGGSRQTNTWECEGSSVLEGVRPEVKELRP